MRISTQKQHQSPTAVSTSFARSNSAALSPKRDHHMPIVNNALHSPGQPLDAATRSLMELRFGHDFSRVRIHAAAKAAESARSVNALAYTVGGDIVFGAEQYSPHTFAGQQTLAHEIAHTLQQPRGSTAGAERISDPHDPAEQDAERAARDVIAGRQADITQTATAGTLHRQPLPAATLRPPRLTTRLMGSEILDSFALNGAALTADHLQRLAVLAQMLKNLLAEYPSASVQIIGHTDATGGEDLNERIGQQRADAVLNVLLKASVPARALSSLSAGERNLRIKTATPEPLNRRVEVRFEPEPKGRLFPSAELSAPRLPGAATGDTRAPEPSITTEQVCIAHPALCAKGAKPDQPRGAEIVPLCTSTNCSAVSVDRFDKQPPDLQSVLVASFADPAAWFAQLDSGRRIALTAIFNRLCRYGVWCHVRAVLRIDRGEATVTRHRLTVPGLTPSVIFMSRSGNALLDALMATGQFCQASGLGASQHPGQSTLREISGSDSLHISIGPGDQCDAHIDHHSPVAVHPGSSFCSNAPSSATVGHIGRELVPEKVRKRTGIPGFQVFPEEPTPSGIGEPEPDADAPRLSPGGSLIGITVRGPLPTQRQPRDAKTNVSAEAIAHIDRAIREQVSPDALLPSHVRVRRTATRKAAEFAGPDEEAALRVARDTAEQETANYPDAHIVARELAERIEQARRSGVAWVKIDLPSYDARDFGSRRAIAKQIQRIALIVRNFLPDRAADVHTVVIIFGSGNVATREEVKLP